jgi:hypothetical protein
MTKLGMFQDLYVAIMLKIRKQVHLELCETELHQLKLDFGSHLSSMCAIYIFVGT